MEPRPRRKYTKTPIEETASYRYYLLWAEEVLTRADPDDDKLSVKRFVRYLKEKHGITISYQAMYVHLRRLIEDELAWYTKYGRIHLEAVHGKLPDAAEIAKEADRI